MDLNADLGEGYGPYQISDDEAILPYITSANVACGFHAGDPQIMSRTVEKLQTRGIRIGAQVGYRDLFGFGRRQLDISAGDLADDVSYQIGALYAISMKHGARLSYVKPHGALYNRCFYDHDQSKAIVDSICSFDPGLYILAQPGSALAHQASQRNIKVAFEGFCDRRYLADGTLAPRSEVNSVITDSKLASDQAQALAQGTALPYPSDWTPSFPLDSLCVHSDTAGAPEILAKVKERLLSVGITIKAP